MQEVGHSRLPNWAIPSCQTHIGVQLGRPEASTIVHRGMLQGQVGLPATFPFLDRRRTDLLQRRRTMPRGKLSGQFTLTFSLDSWLLTESYDDNKQRNALRYRSPVRCGHKGCKIGGTRRTRFCSYCPLPDRSPLTLRRM